MSYNSGVIVLVISNHWPDYSLNCTPLSPITITTVTDIVVFGAIYSTCVVYAKTIIHLHLSE